MRLTEALLGLAALVAAQDGPPAEPPASGLSGLEDTVNTLSDEPAPETLTTTEAPPVEAAPPPEAPPAAETAPDETLAPAETPPSAETALPPAAGTPAPARPAAPAGPLTAAERAQLAAAAQRGRLLFALAHAGNIATQDMLSRLSDPGGAGIAGWIAEPEGNAVSVIFYAAATGGAPPAAVYRVAILGGRATSRDIFLAGNRPPLGPRQARMAAARAATDGLDHQACGGQDFNVLVVPPASSDAPIDVYQLSPAAQRGRFSLGGHFKSTIAADGSVAATRGFANACLDIDAPAPAAGQRPAPIAVTHLLDPLPTEIHVFLSLLSDHPLVVVAGEPQRLFAVSGEGIAELRE